MSTNKTLALLRNRLAPGAADESLPWLKNNLYFDHVASSGSEAHELDEILNRFAERPHLALVEHKGERFAIWRVEIGEAVLALPLRRNANGEPLDESSREILDAIDAIAHGDFSPSGNGYLKLDYRTPLAGDAKVLYFNPRSQPLDRYWLRQLANMHSAITGRTLQDFHAEKVIDDFVIDSLPAGDMGLVVGPGGVGKTWMLLDIAASVATGSPALGGLLKVARAGRVAVLCFEETFKQIGGRLKAISERRGLSCDGIEIYDRDDFTGPNGRDMTRLEKRKKMVEICDRLQLPRLIIIDNAKEVISGSENDDQSVAELMDIVREIGRKNRCAVLLAHHSNEASVKGGARELLKATALRGHSNFNSYTRWQFHVARETVNGEMAIKVKLVKANHGETWAHPQTMVMAKDAEDRPQGFTIPEAPKEARDMLHVVVDAVAALEPKNTKRATADALRGSLGIPRVKIERLIDQAVKKRMLAEVREEGSRAKKIVPANLSEVGQRDQQREGGAQLC